MSLSGTDPDGYISDVVDRHDEQIPSDFSQDFVDSTERLEKHFQDKYKILRNAYETRILKLSEVVEQTCAKLFSDEMLTLLKSDSTSASFIPAHLTEIISSQIHSENERYIQSILQKLSSLELQHSKSTDIISKLQNDLNKAQQSSQVAEQNSSIVTSLTHNLQNLERNYKEYVEKAEEELSVVRQSHEIILQREKQLQNKLNIIIHENEEKTRYCDSLKRRLEAKEKDIQTLEYSFEQNSRELTFIENNEKNENIIKKELKQELQQITNERNILYNENQELRMKIHYASDELDRCHAIAKEKDNENNNNQIKIQELMKQVEIILNQETNESNQAITIVHNKMKNFRTKLLLELQREKRLVEALKIEIQNMKTITDENNKQNISLIESDKHLHLLLSTEKEKILNLQQKIHEESIKTENMKLKLTEKEHEAYRVNEIIHEYERLKSIEIELIQEKTILHSERVKEAEKIYLDKQIETYKLKYENELIKLKKELQDSYHQKEINMKNIENNNHYSEDIYRNSVLVLRQENEYLHEKHEKELNNQQIRLKTQYEKLVTEMQQRLEEASENISKLKGMVRDGKTVIKTQQHQLELMTAEVRLITQQHQGYEHDNYLHNRTTQQQQQQQIGNNGMNHSNVRRSSILSTSSRASSASPSRRSTVTGGGLSPAATAKEVHAHRMALLRRSVSVPRGSTGPVHETTSNRSVGGSGRTAAVSSASVISSGTGSQASNRRSTVSVLGTSHLQTSSISGIFDPVEPSAGNRRNTGVASPPPSSRRSSMSVLGEAGSPPVSARSVNDSSLITRVNQREPQRVESQPTSRRSSVSVLGELSSPPNSARSSTSSAEISAVVGGSGGRSHAALLQAQEEAKAAKRSAEQATANLIVFKEQVYRLEREAKEYDESIRSLQAQIHAANTAHSFSSSDPRSSGVQNKDFSTETSSLLQEKLALLRCEYDEHRKHSETTIAQLQLEHANSIDKCVLLSSQCEHLRMELDQKDDAASTVFSELALQSKEVQYPHIQDSSGGPNTSTATTNAATAAYETSMLQMEENVQHHIELARITTEELSEERQRLRDMRKREAKLYKLIAEIEKVYQREIHGLRQDLTHIRSSVESLEPLAKIEVKRTIQGLATHMQRIFQHNKEIQEEEIKQIRISLSHAHTEEMNALEARFIEQIQIQASKHTEELAQQHMELIAQTESALGISTTTTAELNVSPDDSLDMEDGDHLNSTLHSKTQRNVSFASDAATANHMQRSLYSIDSSSSNSSQRHHTTLNAFGISRRNSHTPTVNGKNTSKLSDRNSRSGNYEHPPAYESVVSGLLEALVSEEMLDVTGSQQIVSLAKAHQEPSFAAQAAARSILCSQLEVFVNNMHDRLSKAALSAHSSTSIDTAYAGTGSSGSIMNKNSNNASVTAISYGADYSVFFD